MESNEPEGGKRERTRSNGHDHGTREDLERASAATGAAIEQLYQASSAFVGRHAEEKPYAVLGVAAGIGFVLGGGLAWRMAGRLMNVAARIAVTRTIENWVGALSDPQRQKRIERTQVS